MCLPCFFPFHFAIMIHGQPLWLSPREWTFACKLWKCKCSLKYIFFYKLLFQYIFLATFLFAANIIESSTFDFQKADQIWWQRWKIYKQNIHTNKHKYNQIWWQRCKIYKKTIRIQLAPLNGIMDNEWWYQLVNRINFIQTAKS